MLLNPESTPPPMPTSQMSPEAANAYAIAQQRIAECRNSGNTRLDLSGLGLTSVPPEIGQLSALTSLSLGGNQLTTLPGEIGHLSALTELALEENQFTTLPPEIGQLSALKLIHLGGNQLTTLPAVIGQFTALTRLFLRENQLTILPPEIGQLSNLMGLDLCANHLTTLCPEVGQLANLTQLDLFGNQLTSLPPEIGQLTALEELNLTNNQLTRLPPEIAQLSALKALNLNNNQLTSLPSEIGKLCGLRELDLSQNDLTSLLPEIGQLYALAKLDLSENRLASLPPEIGRLTSLEVLYLWENDLTSLPPEIGKLAAMTKINLGGNQLKSLPPVIGKLTSLAKLYVWRNQLTSLPPEIFQLTSLTQLHLAGNQLKSVPPEIGRLSSLTQLNLAENQLKGLPPEIGKLKELKELFLHENPRLGIPEETLGPVWREALTKSKSPKSPAEILNAYFRLQGEGGAPLLECKIIVVGRGGVGKTSLIKRLSGKPYDPKESETHGIQISELSFKGEKGIVLGRVWDFGGQAVLHSMHECFLTARSLYVLVLGERDDMLERDAAYWLQLIRSYAGKVPVVVAMNKSAGRQRTFDRKSLEDKYGPILAWVATECSDPGAKSGGIANLKRELTSALDGKHMESVRRKFPVKWQRIKQEMEEMKESFVSYAVFQEICRQHGESDEKEQAALARDLHDLGVAMNYGEKLQDLTILSPDWLGDGIYAVLRANDLDNKLPEKHNKVLALDGVVTEPLLAQMHQKAASKPWEMLKVADYPKDKREYLLRLMDLFHLSYPLNDDATEQLVPTLLPQEPPAEAVEPNGATVTRLRYELPVLPAPLLPWFIARVFSLVPQRLHWRRGAMLALGDARAKVWTSAEEKDVFVTVAGKERTTERLVAIIRAALHGIFAQYKALVVTEHWQYEGEWAPLRTLVKLKALPESLLPPEPERDRLSSLEADYRDHLPDADSVTEEEGQRKEGA